MHFVIGCCVLQVFSYGAGGGRVVLFGGVAFGPLWAGLVGAAAVPVARSSAPPPCIENTPMLGGFGGGALPARSIANTTLG